MVDDVNTDAAPATAPRLKFYERKWAQIGFIAVFLVVFVVWYAERASYSDYKLPPEAPMQQANGVLQLPTGRPKYWSIMIKTDAGEILHFGCEPNESWYMRDNCLTRAAYEAHAGERVRAAYFVNPTARNHRRVLVGLTGADGRVITSAASRLAALEVARAQERDRTWVAQLPIAIAITGIVGLLFAVIHGLVRLLVWLVTRGSRA